MNENNLTPNTAKIESKMDNQNVLNFQKSDRSGSSARKNVEIDMESHSIITEEESAFEDNLSPKAGKKKL